MILVFLCVTQQLTSVGCVGLGPLLLDLSSTPASAPAASSTYTRSGKGGGGGGGGTALPFAAISFHTHLYVFSIA